MTSTTSVLKEAVHRFYNDFKQKETQKTPYELLEELNLVGCINGGKNLSRDYKKELSQSLTKKHNKSKKKPLC